ncbi:Importin-9 [Fragariocoptes setiger]|uniref:Importin-9 n=1 Tax=Fragariocoptes setiger TaxID=1670756 RepID=A0ABQ7SCL0_9ACAR|nr:Importin-9 [Fragariocoptes setiger]
MVLQNTRDANPIKNELLANMGSILNAPAPNKLAECEERIKMLQVTENFAIAALDIAFDTYLDFPLRQLALVLLKQYATVHWKSTSPSFSPPECQPNIKSQVRPLLLAKLGEPSLGFMASENAQSAYTNKGSSTLSAENQEKRLKTSLAAVITSIAIHDWPEEWPDHELLNSLTHYLCSNNRLIVYGAVKVFVDLSPDLTEHQLAHIAPIVLPKIYDVFVQPQSFHISSRCLVLKVLTNLMETFSMIESTGSSTIDELKKSTLEKLLPKMIEALIEGLRAPQTIKSERGVVIQISDLELKNQIIKCLTELLSVAKKAMHKWLDNLLPIIWSTLTGTASIYMDQIVDADHDINTSNFSDDSLACDNEDESVLSSLVRSLIAFVTELVESKRLREKYIKPNICDLMYYLITYMMMTDEQIALWKEDPDQFIIDEDEQSLSNTIRNETYELCVLLSEKYTEDWITIGDNNKGENKDTAWYWTSSVEAVKRHFNELNCAGDGHSISSKRVWKVQESCLLAIGVKPDSFIEIVKSGNSTSQSLSSDLMMLLTSSLQNASDCNPFLTGRILMTSSRYVSVMHDEPIKTFLQATLNGLCNQSDVIKICAARAVQTFCFYLSSEDRFQLLSPLSDSILDRLVQIGLEYSIDVLSVVLEAILTMISSDDDFARSAEPKVAPMILNSILKCETSQSILATVKDIVEALLRSKADYSSIEQRMAPTLLAILAPNQVRDPRLNTCSLDLETISSLRPAILDIIRIMIVESPTPLSEFMVNTAFPVIVNSILNSYDETALIQSGGETIRCLVSKGVDQIARVKFGDTGKTGTDAVLQVCLHLLDPKTNETCCMYIGRLISVYIRKACQYLSDEDKQILLRSVLTKLQSTRMLTVEQSLLVIFAHLINYDHNSVTLFLTQLPAPSGSQSAFDYVITQWLNRQCHFFGKYEIRVTLFALCTLMENSFNHLNILMVPNDIDHNDADANPNITTRSKSKQKQNQQQQQALGWTTLPASLKILKILLDEYWNFINDDCDSDDETDTDTDVTDSDLGDDEEDDDDITDQNEDQMESGNVNSSVEEVVGRLMCARSKDYLTKGDNDFKAQELLYMSSADLDEDDIDAQEDPLNSISLKERLATFLVRFKSSPCAQEFIPHLNQHQKSILNAISV